MARIFRLYAYLYHFVFALYLLGIAIVALLSNNVLKMPFLPWSGPSLTGWLIGGAVTGILSILLAITGVFRYLFPLWSFAMLAVLVRGFFLQPYAFENRAAFEQILWITGGALLAFLASLTLFFVRRRRR